MRPQRGRRGNRRVRFVEPSSGASGTTSAAGLSPKRMRLVFPYADAEPSMVLVEAVRGGRPYLRCGAPLVIYNRDRSYTDEILSMYGRK